MVGKGKQEREEGIQEGSEDKQRKEGRKKMGRFSFCTQYDAGTCMQMRPILHLGMHPIEEIQHFFCSEGRCCMWF